MDFSNAKEAIAKYFADTLPKSDDKPWQAWVDFKSTNLSGDPNFFSLTGLLEQNIRETIEQRVIFLLLVPEPDWNPFVWPAREIGEFFFRPSFVDGLSLDLAKYMAIWVNEFCEALQSRPDCQLELASGERFNPQIFSPASDKYYKALVFYKLCILKLLAILPWESSEAQRLFSNFSLRDVVAFCGLENYSGYNLLMNLMADTEIDERWKVRADKEMQKIVLAERQGLIQPRVEHENAGQWYVNIVETAATHDGGLPYSKGLFVEQIEFAITNQLSFPSSWKVARILELLKQAELAIAEDLKDLRYRFCQRILSQEAGWFTGFFTVDDEKTQQAAQMMLEEFGVVDPWLKQVVTAKIEKYRDDVAKSVEKQRAIEAAEQAILQALK